MKVKEDILDKIVNLKDVRDKKKANDKRKIKGTENDILDYLKEEFDLTLAEIQKPKKGGDKNGITK